jgi:single-strand DNA-binding protein
MANVNKVFLIGNITRDPELRYTPGGAPVTDLGVAVNRYFNTKDGERREETLFIDVTVWNRQAENCCQFLRKGQPVHIEGYLRMDTWDDRNTGEKRSKIKIEAENVQFLGGRRDAGGAPDEDFGGAGGAPPAREPRRSAPAAEPRSASNGPSRSYGAPPPAGGGGGGGGNASPAPRRPAAPQPEPDETDDDIPF